VLVRQRDRLAVDVLHRHDAHRLRRRAQAHRDRDRHRRKEMRGVVLLVEHLVADQRPACGLHQRNLQPLLAIEAERVGHDQRRRAGDRNEADLQVRLLGLALRLRERFERAEWEERRHCRIGARSTDGAQEAPAHCICREQRSHCRGLEHAAVQCFGSLVRQVLGGRVVLGLRAMPAAAARRAQAIIRVERISECGHGNPSLFWLPVLCSYRASRKSL
jgi:hypothetical protein